MKSMQTLLKALDRTTASSIDTVRSEGAASSGVRVAGRATTLERGMDTAARVCRMGGSGG